MSKVTNGARRRTPEPEAAAGEQVVAPAAEQTGTQVGDDDAAGDGGGAAAPSEAASRAGATTTTMIHAGGRGRSEWWRRAVVYEVSARELGGPDLLAVATIARHASRLGAEALLIHPAAAPEETPAEAEALLRRTHQLGLRVLVSVPEREDHLHVLRQWLQLGAEGVDIGAVTAGPVGPPRAVGRGRIQALVASRTEDGILSATASAADPEELLRQLQETWPHHLRDDRLATAPWSAAALRRTITEAYAQRDPLGAPMAWTLHDPFRPTRYTHDPDDGITLDRFRAAALLMLALPGVLYLRQGEQVGLTDGAASAGPRAADRAEAVRALIGEQAGQHGSTYEMFRHALRLRRELRLDTGPLGWVTGLRQAADDTAVAFVNRQVLVLANTHTEPLQLPPTAELLHSSAPVVPASPGGIEVPAGSTIWAQLDPRQR